MPKTKFTPDTHTHIHTNLEKLVYLGEVDSLLGIQLVDVAVVPVHQIQAKAHYLDKSHRGQIWAFSLILTHLCMLEQAGLLNFTPDNFIKNVQNFSR